MSNQAKITRFFDSHTFCMFAKEMLCIYIQAYDINFLETNIRRYRVTYNEFTPLKKKTEHFPPMERTKIATKMPRVKKKNERIKSIQLSTENGKWHFTDIQSLN